MITSPSQNDLATTFVNLHKGDVPVKVVNVSTAPTARTAQRMKDLQTEEIFDGRCAVDRAQEQQTGKERFPHSDGGLLS
ncbi:MAG: hypothetical protein M3385_08575, partial [Actinomycetota bacterium]|nr:hypothetical protein [Actinomycetota bacterium]